MRSCDLGHCIQMHCITLRKADLLQTLHVLLTGASLSMNVWQTGPGLKSSGCTFRSDKRINKNIIDYLGL